MTDNTRSDACDEPCNHNHEPNPYTDPVREETYRTFVRELFRMSVVTVRADLPLTVAHAACAVASIVEPVDPVPTIRAVMWEAARLVNFMTNGRVPEFNVHKCDNPDHHHDDEDGDEAFHDNVMRVFFEAGSAGHLDSAVKVVDSVFAEARARHHEPAALGIALFGNVLGSLSYTASVNNNAGPLYFYEP